MRRIERLIPKALKYIDDNFKQNGVVKKVYSSYISSYGPSIITSGVLVTAMFYEDKEDKINKLFFSLLREEIDIDKENIIDFLKTRHNDLFIRELMMDIVIASKLAIRVFDLKE